MAFTGVTVACCFAPADDPSKRSNQAIIGPPAWSEEPASGVATRQAGAAPNNAQGTPLFRVYAEYDIWGAAGDNPDPENGPRVLIPALTVYDIYVDSNDKFAWVAA